jgi:hypothetical protein
MGILFSGPSFLAVPPRQKFMERAFFGAMGIPAGQRQGTPFPLRRTVWLFSISKDIYLLIFV